MASYAFNSHIAVGTYLEKNSFAPLLLTSHNNGLTWAHNKNISGLPPHLGNLSIDYINCDASTCVAGGQSQIGQTIHPVLLVSNDKGNTWSYINKISGFPSQADKLNIKAIRCTENSCIVAGQLHTNQKDMPMLLVSTNHHTSWSLIPNIAGLPQTYYASISSLSCTEHTCIAVGEYIINKSKIPLLLRSIDGGQSWSLKSIPALPADIWRSYLDAVECSGNTCIIGGSYRTIKNSFTEKLLLAVSHDKGASWKLIETITDFPQNVDFNSPIKYIHCKQNQCVTSGQYDENSMTSYPLILTSADNGDSWSAVKTISGLSHFQQFSLNTGPMDCSGSTCVITGMKVNEPYHGNPSPLLLISQNHGHSWSAINLVLGFPYRQVQEINTYAVHCKDMTCMVSGSYLDKLTHDATKTVPMLLVSQTKGLTWTFNLPLNQTVGELHNLAIINEV